VTSSSLAGIWRLALRIFRADNTRVRVAARANASGWDMTRANENSRATYRLTSVYLLLELHALFFKYSIIYYNQWYVTGKSGQYIHSNTLHSNTFQYIPKHYITLHSDTFRYIPIHSDTFRYITLHYITLHYITLHYITLHYITVHYIRLRDNLYAS
jgi:hypothetical protein